MVDKVDAALEHERALEAERYAAEVRTVARMASDADRAAYLQAVIRRRRYGGLDYARRLRRDVWDYMTKNPKGADQ